MAKKTSSKTSKTTTTKSRSRKTKTTKKMSVPETVSETVTQNVVVETVSTTPSTTTTTSSSVPTLPSAEELLSTSFTGLGDRVKTVMTEIKDISRVLKTLQRTVTKEMKAAA